MRPSRLEIEGFTCFREKQVVDFERLGLFAIAGPTGAGKSSILDAMVFALFGHIPRVGKHGVSEFISLGLDRMAVTFEFEVGAVHYRVVRTSHRARQGKVQLERGGAGAWVPVADSVKGVAEEVERVLGLNHETFQQAVLLPQGQFSKFLKAAPRDQRLILRNLLRVGIYEELRKAASERSTRAATKAEALRQRLDEEYAGTSPAQVAELESRLATLTERVDAVALSLTARRTALGELTERARAWAQVRTQERALATLESERSAVEDAARGLQAARQAAPVVRWADAAEHARGKVLGAEASVVARLASAEAARTAASTAKGLLDAATRAAEEVPGLDDRVRALEGAVALLPGLRACRERLASEQTAARRAEDSVASHRAAMEASTATLTRLAGELSADEQALRELGHDPERHEALRALQSLGARVASSRRAVEDALRELGVLEQRSKGLEDGAAQALAGLVATQDLVEVATARHASLQAERQELERRHQAHVLREHLEVGAPCPVCEQAVGALPGGAAPPALAELRAREAEALEAATRARGEHERAGAVHTRADAAAASAREALTRAAASRAQRVAELEAVEAELTASAVLPPGVAVPEVRLSTALDALGRSAKQHETLSATRAKRTEEIRKEEAALALAQSRLQGAQADQQGALARAEAAEKELHAAETQLRAVAGDSDPKVEQDRLVARAGALRNALEEARATEARCATARSQAEADHRSASEAADQALAARDAAVAQAGQAAQEAGFADLDAAMGAVRSTADQEKLDRRVSVWRAAHEQAERGLAEARPRAGEVPVTDAEVAAERTAIEQAERALGAQQVELGGLGTALEDARRRVAAMGRVTEEWECQRAEHGWYDQLARDLRTDGFEKWLLDGTFRALVQGASVRLLEMSGRYTLDYRDDEFWVVDHDNAREQRKADTLSGGETFLASLCLALELSEQVQRASGAVRLDSLFIDEGFGTLDPETLDTVAGAIELLGEGDRMVGIITHVAELTERLPARVLVRKGPTGSFIQTQIAEVR